MGATGEPRRRLTTAVDLAAAAVLVLFAIHLLGQWVKLPRWGIVPRTIQGLKGVIFAPLLHAGWQHLFANSLPLFLLLILLWADARYRPWRTLACVWVGSGLGTWVIGRGQAMHLGASGVVFGLAAYLIVAGLTLGSARASFVAAVVVLLFGGMFYGVLPQTGAISWECHLCGAASGVWAALRHEERA